MHPRKCGDVGSKHEFVGKNVCTGGRADYMTDYKHPNMFVGNISLKELAQWGEDHPDHWVREMAKHTWLIAESIPKGYTAEQFFESYADDLRNAEIDAEWECERADTAERELRDAKAKRDAALLDLEQSEQSRTVAYLKQRVFDANHEVRDLEHTLELTQRNYDELQKAHALLEEKYNTFTILAT